VRRQCSAKSKRSGVRCGRAPILGGAVCSFHGGKSPQAKRSARQRLAELVDPALTALAELVRQRKLPNVRLGAARDLLDRAGVVHEQKPGAGMLVLSPEVVAMGPVRAMTLLLEGKLEPEEANVRPSNPDDQS